MGAAEGSHLRTRWCDGRPGVGARVWGQVTGSDRVAGWRGGLCERARWTMIAGMSRALVVDDAATFRRALVRMLVRRGLDTDEASDGAAALTALAAPRDVAVVMIDCMMPGMNGVELIARLRRDARYDGVKLVLVTGLEECGASELATVAGADAVLLKPFREAELAAVLDRLGVPRRAA